jgi:phage tail sheath protein FI
MYVVPPHPYPGVYIQEVPSSTHTIVGVSTSTTAFIGRALRGDTTQPTTITSYADFERGFGGLWSESALASAVKDFYLNGGSTAIVVRLYHAETDGKTNAVLQWDTLTLEARDPGSWGNNLRMRVTASQAKETQQRFGLDPADLFDLTIYDANTNNIETFSSLSFKPGSQQVDKILESQSQLVRLQGSLPTAGTKVPKAHADKPAKKGASLWNDDTTSTGVAQNDYATDGEPLTAADFVGDDQHDVQVQKAGLYMLEHVDLFNLLCIPPYNGNDVDAAVISESATYCEQRRAMLIVDPPSSWGSIQAAINGIDNAEVGTSSSNAMLFFPRIRRYGELSDAVPSGAVAGIIARTDIQRGVWKAPAGLDAVLNGVARPSIRITNEENGELNPLAINCLRSMPPAGTVIWGARTLNGDDRLGSQWKYIPVRRLALYIEESLYRGTQWAVFEPNAEPLWAQLRLNIGAFMNNLFRQGAFQGQTPKDAYFVQCDNTTTLQNDIDQGIVNVYVGFAPLKPAEFVILYLQQIAGQLAV